MVDKGVLSGKAMSVPETRSETIRGYGLITPSVRAYGVKTITDSIPLPSPEISSAEA
jgi:hypothetical protein